MQYTVLGRTGYKVSRIGFGAMRLPTLPDGTVDFDQSTALMRRAFALGINFVDSQYHYCGDQSEEGVGRAIAGRREKVIVQTKAAYYDAPKYAPGESHRSRLEMTLKRLGTDYVDIYLMHALQWDRWQEHGAAWMAMARQAQKEGLIRHIGLSCHDTLENTLKFIDMDIFDVVLMQYNLLDQRYEKAFERAFARNMGATSMGPIGGGRLSGPSQEFRKMLPDIATTAELALRFVLSNPAIHTAFSGMRTFEEIEQNAEIGDRATALTSRERESILAVLAEKQKLSELYCTGCNYCSPCPQGVAISHIFGAMGLHAVWGLTEAAKRRYQRLIANPENKGADVCTGCGACEPKCPQKLSIREQLRECARVLGEKAD